jgi:RHS repeat-associated protein
VALSDAAGDTIQTYEYSVYGEVAVEDANHPNPYMFAGVCYDIEICLYYNRARYYNPFMGRFLQTDPVGYEAGMNLYACFGNNPLWLVDPHGTVPFSPDGNDVNLVGDPNWNLNRNSYNRAQATKAEADEFCQTVAAPRARASRFVSAILPKPPNC